MFEYERLDRADPAYALGNLYHGVQLVIDYWEKPIRNFEEIPLVISPKFEGGFMEPALRTHSEMALRDIRARMPAFVEMALRLNGKKVGTALRPLYAANTLSGRARRFREKAGAIGWEKNASTAIKEFMDQVVKPINNSTLDREDLTPQQLAQLRALTADTHSERRKTTTTEAASAAYMADTLRRARLAGANRLRRTVIDFEPYQASSPRNFHLVQSSCPSEPKPSVLSMTAEEASTRNDVDLSDGKHSIPTTPAELNAIHRALQLTVDHFYGVIGHLPTLPGTGTYISQYVDIQRQFGDSWLGGQPTPPPFSVEANGVGVLGTGRTVLSFAVMDGEEGETLLDVAFASLVSWGYLDSSLA